MSELGRFLAQSTPPERAVDRPTHPKGWEPGISWDGTTGVIVTDERETAPDEPIWRELIADWGLDSSALEIVDGSIELIGWDSPVKGTNTGEKIRLKRYKARLRRRLATGDRVDVEALCKLVERRKPAKQITAIDGRALVVCLADLQVGKGGGDGTEGTVRRVLAAVDRLPARVKAIKPCAVYVIGMGDIAEQCSGNYPSQPFTVDLNRREQMRVARRLVAATVDAVIAAPQIVLSAVPGNHGENRNADGKAYTTIDDNDDLAVFENVAEVLAANPDRYGHVSVALATDATVTFDIAGVPVAFRHGHLGGRGAHGAHKIEEWWRGQVLGRQEGLVDAQILVSAHYHHFLCSESTSRTVFQCPPMDPGSNWWRRITGADSPAGMLTFGVGSGYGPRGWGDLAIL